MTAFTIDALRHETPFVLRLMRRNLPKRAATAAMMLAVLALAGSRSAAAWVAMALVLFEANAAVSARLLHPGPGDAGRRLALWVWATNSGSVVTYLVPALILVTRPDLPWVLAGWLWLFGVYVHITNSFVALPVYNWSQMAIAFAMGLVATGLAGFAHDGGGPPWPWAVVLALTVVYGVNTVETIAQQKETQAALDAARAEARTRLSALERAARIDPLTGLLNRQAFDAALRAMLDRRRGGGEVTVFLMDLDGFKPLNDTHGHAAGDAVLAVTGRRLAALAGDRGVAARLGGDELALALPGPRDGAAALDLGRRIAREIERPVLHEGVVLRVGGSVGIAIGGVGDGRAGAGPVAGDRLSAQADHLIAAADRAMLSAKAAARQGGESHPVLHDPVALPSPRSAGARLRLAQALDRGEVVPRYTPIRHLATGAIHGFKVEPAWDGPAGGGIAGVRLHARVEELGLQGALLTAMAARVLRDVEGLLAEGLDPGRVTLRLPEMALATPSGRLALDRLLEARPAARARLEVAVPGEVLAGRAADRVREGLAHLRAMGLAVAITGFGTGRAAFVHLGQVGFDELRIDAAFVAGLGRDPAALAAARAVAATAEAFGARLVAEGVETADQRHHLLGLGCRHGRGPLVGRPLDAPGLRDLLLADRAPIGPVEPLPGDPVLAGSIPAEARLGR